MYGPNIDKRYHGLRDTIAAEAAKAYTDLDGHYNIDVVLWETMVVAALKNRTIAKLLRKPGVFIAAICNEYGQGEYSGWRNEVISRIEQLQDID